ncbi:MAG TPA: helix-turn-helix transcriptional regulator [Candidatus Angelobacter sp.]|nr:helix-turn-helix transcriptional regulator [Candidatus Angelobacter sp.]
MTRLAKKSQKEDLENLNGEPQFTSLISRENLVRRLNRGAVARARFVESHVDKSVAFQIRSLRNREKWTQAQFAKKLGIKHQNNVSARLENPNYGKHTLTTLKKIAATCDVGLVVWFVPFSRLADWVTGTPHTDKGLLPEFYNIPAFDNDPELDKTSTHMPKVARSDKTNLRNKREAHLSGPVQTAVPKNRLVNVRNGSAAGQGHRHQQLGT